MTEPNADSTPAPTGDPSRWVARAVRIRVGAPIAYRSVFEDRWAQGRTIDISRTGVLFQPADPAAPVAADLQAVIYLSRASADVNDFSPPMPDLYCGGRLARAEPAAPSGRGAVAMQIDFEWAEAPPGRLWDTGIE